MSRFKAALFDLDGTLLDTLDDLAEAMNASLVEQGFPPRTIQDCRLFVGDGARVFAGRALPEDRRDGATIERVLAGFRHNYGHLWDKKTRPYEGVPELLDRLSTRTVRLFVLSNKPDDFTRLMIERLLPRWTFFRVQGELPDVPKKPDPSAALAMARTAGVSPQECIFIGDTGVDMRCAKAAQMYAVGVLWGFRDASELRGAGADVLVGEPLEIVELLD